LYGSVTRSGRQQTSRSQTEIEMNFESPRMTRPSPPSSPWPGRGSRDAAGEGYQRMSVLVDTNTRLVVQGITGSAGAFHTRQCIDYGTSVVAGVTPGKGGQLFDEKLPVFDTVCEALRETACSASMV